MNRRNFLVSSVGLPGAAFAVQDSQPIRSAVAGTQPAGAHKQWWMDEPVRLILVLLNENQSSIDPDKLVQQLVDMNANALLLPTGGIAAHYPTNVEFHYRSPSLPAGRDLVGEVLQRAHARGIRFMSRFEWRDRKSTRLNSSHLG